MAHNRVDRTGRRDHVAVVLGRISVFDFVTSAGNGLDRDGASRFRGTSLARFGP